jgi:hypothetical protein
MEKKRSSHDFWKIHPEQLPFFLKKIGFCFIIIIIIIIIPNTYLAVNLNFKEFLKFD